MWVSLTPNEQQRPMSFAFWCLKALKKCDLWLSHVKRKHCPVKKIMHLDSKYWYTAPDIWKQATNHQSGRPPCLLQLHQNATTRWRGLSGHTSLANLWTCSPLVTPLILLPLGLPWLLHWSECLLHLIFSSSQICWIYKESLNFIGTLDQPQAPARLWYLGAKNIAWVIGVTWFSSLNAHYLSWHRLSCRYCCNFVGWILAGQANASAAHLSGKDQTISGQVPLDSLD